jgi:hypothetical protein
MVQAWKQGVARAVIRDLEHRSYTQARQKYLNFRYR